MRLQMNPLVHRTKNLLKLQACCFDRRADSLSLIRRSMCPERDSRVELASTGSGLDSSGNTGSTCGHVGRPPFLPRHGVQIAAHGPGERVTDLDETSATKLLRDVQIFLN